MPITNVALGGGIIVSEGDKFNKIESMIILDPVTGLPKDNVAVITPNQLTSTTATITAAGSLSGGVDLGLGRLVRIQIPADWTAASVTFQVSTDGVTYFDLFEKGGAEYTVTASASRSHIIPAADFVGVRYLKVRSGTSAAAVTQLTTNKIITLVLAS